MPGILNVSEAAAIGVHAMMIMVKDPSQPQRVPAMAKSLQVSAAHLQKVLQRLVHAGLVRSSRGPKGGYALARSSRDIRMGEVFAAIEGRPSLTACLLDKERCCMGACVLGDMLHSINEQVTRKLQTRLSDINNNNKEGGVR
ncbi:MAG: Rrf2 family transcriptional regulator [Elusimicrobia bacterium]|nr:Rrf2 family transcriptional regulator [Elusimicrobiota bacterium]